MVGRLIQSLTPVGRAVVLLGPTALIVALISGWREFSVIGVGSMFAVMVGIAFIGRPQALGVSRTLVPSKVMVGESSTGVVSVRNSTRRKSGPRDVEDVLGDRIVQLSIPALKPGEQVDEHYTVPAPRRGVFDVGPVRLTRSDPLGLFRSVQGQGTIERLWVRPRVHALRSISAGWAKDIDGPTSDTAPRGSAAFHALREYQFGDDLRHVHWRTSARRNQLMVRHFVDTRRTQEVVVLDPRIELYTSEAFEAAVEVAASVCASGERAGRVVTLVLPSQVEGAQDDRQNYLDRLTLVIRLSGLTPQQVIAPAGRAAQEASALIVITGDGEPQNLIDLARRFLRSGLVLVVRIAPDGEPSYRAVSGGRVVSAPSADRLPGVWAEAVARA
jgi:uncharacterized protein (DUF58 family)